MKVVQPEKKPVPARPPLPFRAEVDVGWGETEDGRLPVLGCFKTLKAAKAACAKYNGAPLPKTRSFWDHYPGEKSWYSRTTSAGFGFHIQEWAPPYIPRY